MCLYGSDYQLLLPLCFYLVSVCVSMIFSLGSVDKAYCYGRVSKRELGASTLSGVILVDTPPPPLPPRCALGEKMQLSADCARFDLVCVTDKRHDWGCFDLRKIFKTHSTPNTHGRLV